MWYVQRNLTLTYHLISMLSIWRRRDKYGQPERLDMNVASLTIDFAVALSNSTDICLSANIVRDQVGMEWLLELTSSGGIDVYPLRIGFGKG